jgi:hypothetical protein
MKQRLAIADCAMSVGEQAGSRALTTTAASRRS